MYARVIVAGGGGGTGSNTIDTYNRFIGGQGGGPTAETGDVYYDDDNTYKAGTGGTQTTFGSSYYGTTLNSTSYGKLASFGVGASASGEEGVSGGGGGWYGGGYGYRSSGGGGSGYVYTSSTASNYPIGCLLNSSYYLTNAETVPSSFIFWDPFTDFDGTNVDGHSGDGAVRISGTGEIYNYSIPRVLGLTDITITKGTSYNLTTGVTYICATGSTSCTNIGPNITSTTSLTKGVHTIYYTVKYNNINYMYGRTITVT